MFGSWRTKKAKPDWRNSFQSYIYKQRMFVVNGEAVKVRKVVSRKEGLKEGLKEELKEELEEELKEGGPDSIRFEGLRSKCVIRLVE